MPDTHDERGGDEVAMLLAIRRRALTASTYAEWHQVGRDIETLGQKLANATARAEKAKALAQQQGEIIKRNTDASRSVIAQWEAWAARAESERDEARALMYRIVGAVEHAYALNTYVELEPGEVAPTIASLWAEVREIRGVAPDAAQDGRSEPVERSETSGGSFQANTSSILPQGLSEPEPPRDTSAWCWAPNPNGPLCCGRLRDHEPPHRRGERTWNSDTTEDGQHG